MARSGGGFGAQSDGGYSSFNRDGRSIGGDSSNDFTRLSHVIASNIQKMQKNTAQLKRIVDGLASGSDTAELRDKLHETQHYTNQLAKDTSSSLKKLAHLPTAASMSEQRQQKMQKERLTNEFSTVLHEFQTLQRDAASKEKEIVKRARASSATDPFSEDRKDDLLGLDSAPGGGQSLQQEHAGADLTMLHERENAIRQLESDITDVNQIFKDLGMLVHEQGEVIDSIEANVESAAVHVESGAEQLSSALKYQRKARRKKFICAALLLLVLIIIIIIIVVSVKMKS